MLFFGRLGESQYQKNCRIQGKECEKGSLMPLEVKYVDADSKRLTLIRLFGFKGGDNEKIEFFGGIHQISRRGKFYFIFLIGLNRKTDINGMQLA